MYLIDRPFTRALAMRIHREPWLREPNAAPNSNSKNMGTKLKFKMRAHEDVIDGCAFFIGAN